MAFAPWVLTRGLTTWRGEINSVFPNRDKKTDGSIAGGGHTVSGTGHVPDRTNKAEYRDGDSKNEVRAIDVDKDLKHPKFTMEQLIQWLVSLGRAGVYLPFRYFIYHGRIWRKATGWKTEKYNGSNKHSEHAHFSGDYSQKADEWTKPLGLAAYLKKLLAPKPAPKPAPPKPGQKLPHYPLGSRVLKQGSTPGDDVAHIQKVAGGTKHFGAADGVADAQFKKGVQRYQRIVGLDDDGVVGPKTWAMIKKIK